MNQSTLTLLALLLTACGAKVVDAQASGKPSPGAGGAAATTTSTASGGAGGTGGAGSGGGCAGSGGCTPDSVGSAAPCLTGGDVLHLDGEPGNVIYSGQITLHIGSWWIDGTTPTYVGIHYSTDVHFWDFSFDTHMLPGIPPLAVQLYPNAGNAPGQPGESIDGDGVGCDGHGRFQIETITFAEGMLKDFTATFEQQCDVLPQVLRGCVHFEQQ